MNGKKFSDLPPEIQKKIAKTIFNQIKEGKESGAFGVGVDKELSEYLGDAGFLEANVSDIIRSAVMESTNNNNNNSSASDGYDDQLRRHRNGRRDLLKTRNEHLNKLRSLLGNKVVDTITLEEDKFFEDISSRMKDLRQTVQQIDKDLYEHMKRFLDEVQFVETDRLMLYNIREVIHNCMAEWTKETLLIHRGVGETLDTIEMVRCAVPAAVGELEAYKKEKGV